MTHSEHVTLSPEERETVHGAVRALRAAAPHGWEHMEFVFRATVGIDSSTLQVVDADGDVRPTTVPGQAADKMDDLRRLMYREGEGAWFTARLRVERSGRFSAEFDYDGEPDFHPPLTADAYALDLERFPRSAEHVPDWLRARLAAE
ncbi:hypothetical protein Arub01_10640 [Actinomadura rubrobrunea]|uniref:DUF600 family protein n=1 Tax=Actinomadura rubrobrunea TaxID=115335 RepID=A0A9W6PSI9_9ACTN|nr:hypothetical protein [Actinomadura rubrobrunea]GLW62820.1 hypothetical protein Arub01_10640 [Actinomadura rubrobrunea]